MQIKIYLSDKYGWKIFTSEKYKLYIKGYFHNLNENKLLKLLINLKLNSNNLKSFFKKIDGNFGLVFLAEKNVIIALDKIGSIPIIYYHSPKKIIISDNYKNILNNLNFKPKIDEFQALHFSMTGYTWKNNTLSKEIRPVGQGNIHLLNTRSIKKIRYYDWRPQKKPYSNLKEIKNKLKKINHKIIDKLIDSSKGNYIVVPLSSGLDSRFILSGLYNRGYKNIIAFSYGTRNNRDAKVANDICKYLKIPWYFVEYNNVNQRTFSESKDFNNFKTFSDTLTSIQFFQDLYAIKLLKEEQKVPHNSIFVNGQTGDFISGNHIPQELHSLKTVNLTNFFYNKNYKMWKIFLDQNYSLIQKKINTRVKENIERNSTNRINQIYEKIEFEERQSKYVINGQRAYEFFGYDWRLPLWDSLYLDFWESVPNNLKLKQYLYKKVLFEQNWANVWTNFPVNPNHNYSLEIKLLRLFLKSLFLFFGKRKWHKFEVKYLEYFTCPLASYARWPYSTMIKDKKGFCNALSWHTAEYLNEKNKIIF